jgi:hypothetical protein
MHARSVVVASMTALALSLISGSSSANAAAPEWRTPSSAGGAWLVGASPVEVDREELRIACAEGADGPECEFVARYVLHNMSAAEVTTRGAFYGTHDATIELDGKSVRTDATSEDLAAVDAIVRQSSPEPEAGAGDRTPFAITVGAGTRATLVFRGRLTPTFATNPNPYYGFIIPAYIARHPLLHTRPREEARYEFQYLVHPLRAWAGARAVHIEVRWPRSWDYAHPALDGAGPFAVHDEGGTRVASCDADGARAGTLGLAFRFGGRTLLDGGPLIGVGGQPEPGDVRLRAGWELAGPDWLTWSVVAETNARDRFAVAGVIDASLPDIVVFWPAIGLGVGPIVGGGPRGPYGGARIQGTLSWPFLSFVLPIDIVAPSFTTGSGALVTVALMGQLSL